MAVRPEDVLTPLGREEIKEIAAAVVAIMLVGGFFAIVGIPLFAIFGDPATSMQDKTTAGAEWIKGVSAYLAGLVGAVVGYYFRVKTE